MNNEPREKLRELIVEYGHSLCDDPRRCEALLKDYCGQYKREIFALVIAQKNRVAADLLKTSSGVPYSMVLARLNKRLEEELGLAENVAQWAVESWALALGLIQHPLPVIKTTSVLTPASPIVQKAALTPPRAAKILLADRYRDNGDGTVTDMLTDLQWMRFSLGQEWKNDTCFGEAKKYTWQQALDAADTLNHQGGYAGCRDWRVPNKEELLTLVYCSSGQPKTWNDTGERCRGHYARPTIYQLAFPNTPARLFWSSSIYVNDPILAWPVNFIHGGLYTIFKADDYPVRLVRGRQ